MQRRNKITRRRHKSTRRSKARGGGQGWLNSGEGASFGGSRRNKSTRRRSKARRSKARGGWLNSRDAVLGGSRHSHEFPMQPL